LGGSGQCYKNTTKWKGKQTEISGSYRLPVQWDLYVGFSVLTNTIRKYLVGSEKFLCLVSVGIPGLESYATGR
jgi:hypothetical protein